MKSSAAFRFVYVASALLFSVSASCSRSVSCPCISSNRSYTFCIDGLPLDTVPCEKWSHCQECRDNLDSCSDCPQNIIGSRCSEGSEHIIKRKLTVAEHIRRKRTVAEHIIRRKRRTGSCRSLKNLRFGNITCLESGRLRSCTARCRKGYKFQQSGDDKLTIQCIDGSWTPMSSFPPCISTTTDRTPTCLCQSRGTCDSEGKCICTRGRTGRYCERLEKRRASCPDPGIPSGSERFHGDGSSASLHYDFREGESVLYSCNKAEEGLERATRITCKPDGTWSAKPPECLRIEDRSANDNPCTNPGPISNGQLVELNGRPGRRANRLEYPVGTRLQYSCVDGYIIRGPSILVCRSGGSWNVRVPICVEDCGHPQVEGEGKISHGERTLVGEWPWIVAISVTEDNYTSMVCGGALLDRNTILTAAHCLEMASEYTLRFGKFYLRDRWDDEGVQIRRTSRVIYHPGYENETYDNDVGLMFFTPSVRYSERVQPICLPTQDTTTFNVVPGNRGYVTGWGKTEKALAASELTMAHLPLQADDLCVQVFDSHDVGIELKGDSYCAGFQQGVTSACQGDSGSPMVFFNRISARYTVEGIVSYGIDDECGEPGRFTVFTKVARYMSWILRNWRR